MCPPGQTTDSFWTPPGRPAGRSAPRAGAFTRPDPTLTSTAIHPSDNRAVGEWMDGTLQELAGRGLDEPYARQLIERFPQERIQKALAYWDALPDAGPGLLVKAIREGRAPAEKKRDLLGEQRKYGDDIRDWLTQNMPEFNRPNEGPHPAAVAAVIRLHHQHGKGRITRREHGSWIRQFVKDWKKRMEE